MRLEKISLSKDMFQEAKGLGLSFSDIIEREAKKHKKFNESVKLSAFEQQLAARDLKLAGAHASLVEDFFRTEDNKLLFVETINEFIKIGMLEQTKSFASLDEIVATKSGIDGSVYQAAEVDLASSTAAARRVGESGEFPQVTIKFKGKSITLYKVGYEIKATYEAIRRMKTNVFGVTMKVIGRNITKAKIAVAVGVLVNGDGNANPITSVDAETAGTLTYADYVNLEESFEFFDPNLMISQKAMRIAYRNLTEYKDKNGPAMAEPPKKCSAVPENKIIALDSRASLEEVYERGGSLVEYDKVINKQLETAVVSEVSGYAKLFSEASLMLNVGTAE